MIFGSVTNETSGTSHFSSSNTSNWKQNKQMLSIESPKAPTIMTWVFYWFVTFIRCVDHQYFYLLVRWGVHHISLMHEQGIMAPIGKIPWEGVDYIHKQSPDSLRLTNRARGPYWGLLTQGRVSRCKHDQRPIIFPSRSRASLVILVSSLLYGTQKHKA